MLSHSLRACCLFPLFAAIATPRFCSADQASAAPSPLIERQLVFGNPERANPKISPDGAQISFLAPEKGVLNVWVAPANEPGKARAITHDTGRGIRQYHWAHTNKHILYIQDKGGDENWRVYCVELASGSVKDLTPFAGVAARIQEVGHKFPDEILVAINNRDPKVHDIHRVNIITGEMKLVQENPGFVGFVTDDDYRVRLGSRILADGGSEVSRPDGKGGWTEFLKIGRDDMMTTNTLGFDAAGKTLYMFDSRGRDTGALMTIDIDSGQSKMLAEDARADAGDVMIHPTKKTIQAVSFEYDRQNWRTLDPSIEADLGSLRKLGGGDIDVLSRSLDDNTWLVSLMTDVGPVKYFRYDRPKKAAEFLFTNRPALEGVALSPMRPTVIKSRDGMNLVSYCTLPHWTDTDADGRPDKPLPMVLFVHGGPWGRDSWGFNPYHQWLSNRGYAVLSVNFRGSTGLGKKFVNAANLEWAGTMHNDLIDAVDWAVKGGVADPKKIAIMGGSYGGYATLVGLTFTPDTFACGVDIVGPSSLITLLNTIPPYWAPMMDMFTTRVGDHRTEAGRKLLEERSPLSRVDKIKKPLLIGQGANDPRVKQAESDQIVQAMQKKSIPVTYVLFPDEGHGFQRPENSMAFNAVVEAFLAQHLGGRYETIGDDFKGSSISVPTGAEQVPGLKDGLPRT